jgi:hypothetical protein
MLFDSQVPAGNSESDGSQRTPRVRLWLSNAAIFALTAASTASFLLCPCDTVTLRDHHALSLVGLSFLLAIAAAVLVYRRMARNTGITGFLRGVIALAIVSVGVFVELFLAMEVIAWLAQRGAAH